MDVSYLAEVPPWEWPADAGASILEALRDRGTDPRERLVAAELAGDLVVLDDEMAEALLTVVGSPEEGPELRAAAAMALGPVLEEIDLAYPDPDDASVTEPVARAIRDGLHEVYLDPEVPVLVRRRALEASVRCIEGWHPAAVRAAYHSGDHDWRLTAVFCMGFVRGFDAEIVEALESGDPALHFEAVRAAGAFGVEDAWRHVRSIVRSPNVDKPLLLAAIEAVASIRPEEAQAELADLTLSDDEEIEAAVRFALALAGPSGEEWTW